MRRDRRASREQWEMRCTRPRATRRLVRVLDGRIVAVVLGDHGGRGVAVAELDRALGHDRLRFSLPSSGASRSTYRA